MKLVRFGQPGSEKPGLVGADGVLRDLSSVVADLGPDTLSPASLKAIAEVRPSSLPAVTGEQRFGVPLSGIGKFLAIGLNYSDHAAEAGLPVPSEPIVFQKAITSLSGQNHDVMLPQSALNLTARSNSASSFALRRLMSQSRMHSPTSQDTAS